MGELAPMPVHPTFRANGGWRQAAPRPPAEKLVLLLSDKCTSSPFRSGIGVGATAADNTRQQYHVGRGEGCHVPINNIHNPRLPAAGGWVGRSAPRTPGPPLPLQGGRRSDFFVFFYVPSSWPKTTENGIARRWRERFPRLPHS